MSYWTWFHLAWAAAIWLLVGVPIVIDRLRAGETVGGAMSALLWPLVAPVFVLVGVLEVVAAIGALKRAK